ncbi:MAG: nucleotide sugar dehydrogenase [Ignavibacteriales bacterium]|nr:MAG: nucleotide sugar dehydrogenase [Ignavibacteriaceae bacterium]MBW7873546.1 nucleotide sugar dehydrogenase [Ignavibacteria bacterium]MCZ2143777.1 nucleotide sugar dehydrogenase [Ignavibacteriales bacterium]MBV6445952.1 UDP-N-acetyl-D-glucosamine 6-dehydrogenase [Ignavibacteriaceae bacterium]MBZ0196206.1 nucleotide sugar dehydrogenase [Ignavibacteriaceae bacterium]
MTNYITSLLQKIENKTITVGVIGLGYVGLPLAVEFGKKYKVIGFDINTRRVEELKKGEDKTLEVEPEELKEARHLIYSYDKEELRAVDVFIVTVPTPVDDFKIPDLTPLIKASETVGTVIKPGAVVVYESTVYPGCTEEDCLPVVEKQSGLKLNTDFFAGYSPERINPGDKEHRVSTIKKVTSGSTSEVAKVVDELYKSVIKAGTHVVSSIKVAEASKVIENTQRDINIAFVNELSMLFNKMGIDTVEVLEAAGTKWNFLPFRPGLVGGHCIGVDPYYLTHKAVNIGYHPEIILAGRRINDGMGAFIASQFVKLLIKDGCKVAGSKVLVLGITFKENCPDIRNSKVIDIITELKEFGCSVDVCDPLADPAEVQHEYGIDLTLCENLALADYEGIVLAVGHNQFKQLDIASLRAKNVIIYDVKSLFDKQHVNERL